MQDVRTSVSGCANMCTAPASKEPGIHGVARLVATAEACTGCGECLEARMERIVSLPRGRPVINDDCCRLCCPCIRVCPTGTIAGSRPPGSPLE